jgi:hypothetical protein
MEFRPWLRMNNDKETDLFKVRHPEGPFRERALSSAREQARGTLCLPFSSPTGTPSFSSFGAQRQEGRAEARPTSEPSRLLQGGREYRARLSCGSGLERSDRNRRIAEPLASGQKRSATPELLKRSGAKRQKQENRRAARVRAEETSHPRAAAAVWSAATERDQPHQSC